MNYGLVYTAWGLGGFMLSLVAGAINDTTKTFTYAYVLAAGLLVLASIMMYMIKAPQKDESAAKLQSGSKKTAKVSAETGLD
jgi:MFS transporter, OFA family, oxalate/formate antiporter